MQTGVERLRAIAESHFGPSVVQVAVRPGTVEAKYSTSNFSADLRRQGAPSGGFLYHMLPVYHHLVY